jgi:ketosteroid isomerase-like protein
MEVWMLTNRIALLAAFCVLATAGCAASSGDITESDRTAIRSAVQDFTNAVLHGDFATAASHWAEDGTAMPPNAPAAHGRADVQKLFAGFGKITSFNQNVVGVGGKGDMAYSDQTFEVTFVPPGAAAPITDKGKGVFVWKKQGGSWLVTRGAWNSDLPLPR